MIFSTIPDGFPKHRRYIDGDHMFCTCLTTMPSQVNTYNQFLCIDLQQIFHFKYTPVYFQTLILHDYCGAEMMFHCDVRQWNTILISTALLRNEN